MEPIIFLKSTDISKFLRAVFVNFHVCESFSQETFFVDWVDRYVNNKGLSNKVKCFTKNHNREV